MDKKHEPKVLLLYPPEQRWPGMMVKPNGSLAYPALGGALRDINCHVEVYDACVVAMTTTTLTNSINQ